MSTFAAPAHVLVRGVADSFTRCLTTRPGPLDLVAARAEHAGYVDMLRELGLTVETISPDDACPDSCFVEDTAVITGRHAVLTRPGAESRRAEVAAVGGALSAHRSVHEMRAPATLDGGDVLRVGARLFVGLSRRTNREGADFLAQVAALDGLEVTTLAVPSGLHLKSACTVASATTLVYAPSVLAPDALDALRAASLTCVPAREPEGGNVLALGDVVLVSADAPRTADSLAALGLTIRPIRATALHAADGGLTCLSLRIPREGAWTV